MFHKHNYVESKDGKSIYCTICGKIKHIPCSHEYDIEKTITRYYIGTDKIYSFVYIKTCKKCLEHTSEEIFI